MSDSIRRGGENISAFEVERVLLSHPDVIECAAVGVPSDLTEEEVKVVVVRRPGTDTSAATLVEFSKQFLPKHAVPRYVELVASLPRTPTEKVAKAALRSLTPGTFDAAPKRRFPTNPVERTDHP